jgi:uncharacterized protein (DUF2062 family)
MPGHLPRNVSVVLFAAAVTACGAGSPAPSSPAATTSAESAAPLVSEPTFEARAVGPLTNVTALQIVSIFPYEPGETLISPATEIGAFLSDARQHQGFGKDALRPMLVTPTPPTVKAGLLLAIAWGLRAEFSIERAKEMGHAAMRETIERGVGEMAYAPIARDQGVTSLAADRVAAAFVEGALAEFLTEQKADPRKAIGLKHVTYEAGPAFVDAVSKAVAEGVAAGHAGFEAHPAH